MAPRNQLLLEEQRDFSGGLNLSVDPYKLGRNESFDLQNVDVDRRGGFGVRRGIQPFIDTNVNFTPSPTPDSGYTYEDNSFVRHILVARNGNVKRWDGAAWQNVITGLAVSGRTQFAEFRNVLYILPPGQIVPYTWTGSGSATTLTTVVGNYNDDLTAPNAGNFPACRTFATHKEVMWAAGVIDTGPVTHNSRVRWSHPGQGQDWRTNDFIDIDPDDEKGWIRALIPFGDRLLVFKDKAVYAIHGAPPSGFTVENLTKELGAPTFAAIKATEQYVYFWDIDKGAWRYDGKKFEWIFEPLYRLIEDGKINVPFSNQVIVEFHRDRLWLSVPMLAPPYENSFVSLVFQPAADKGTGAWTVHTATLFGWWIHRASSAGGDEHLIGGNIDHVYELDVENLYQDTFFQRGLVLEGGAEYASTPDAAQHDIATDIDVSVQIMRDDLTTFATSGEVLFAKWNAVAGGRSWAFSILDGGFLEFVWSEDGTNVFSDVSTAPVIDAMRHPTHTSIYLRATLDVDNGSGGNTLTFYTTPGDAPFTQLGDPKIDVTGTTNVFNGSAELTVGSIHGGAGGSFPSGAHDNFNGTVLRASLKDGINGTEKANPVFSSAVPGVVSFADASGLTWSMLGGGAIAHYEYDVAIEAWYATRWFDAGKSAEKKRWKRPVVVMRAGSEQKTLVDVFRDYDPTRVFKTFELNTTLDGDTGIWDDPASDWDVAKWAAEVTLAGEKSIVLRGVPLSGGVARSLRFKNTSKGQDWRIHGLTMKWIPRRIRN